MKSEHSLKKSRNARLNQTKKHCEQLAALIALVQGQRLPIVDSAWWIETRDLVWKISQGFHEANAYNNAMVPDGQSFEQDEYEAVAG
jgi:hypothetical protein